MSRFLFLLVGVIVLSKTNAIPLSSKTSLTSDDSDDEFSVDDWNEFDNIYSRELYGEGMDISEKRTNRDALMRRSTLDKNFMRFGRSSFFPADRCCKQKDLVGLAENYASDNDAITLTKRETESNFMRSGRGGDNFMRFGRPEMDKSKFIRLGRGGSDNFMRFGRPEKDKGILMRFGRDNKGNFMRFGRGRDDNFMRFGRGDKDNFIRFGRGDNAFNNQEDPDEQDIYSRLEKSENFIRFGKNPANFIRYGKSGGKDDSFIRFGKSGRNATNFLRFGRELAEDGDGGVGFKTNLATRRKRMAVDMESPYNRIGRSPELMEDVLPERKRSAIGENTAKQNLIKLFSLLNRNHSIWEDKEKSVYPSAQRNGALKPNKETYKRKQDGSGFIRFG